MQVGDGDVRRRPLEHRLRELDQDGHELAGLGPGWAPGLGMETRRREDEDEGDRGGQGERAVREPAEDAGGQSLHGRIIPFLGRWDETPALVTAQVADLHRFHVPRFH